MPRRAAFVLLALAGLAAPAATGLAPVPAAAEVRPFVALHGGWGHYAMSDVNGAIDEINLLIAPFRLQRIRGGTTVGGEAGVKLPTGTALGVAFERLAASTFMGDPSLYIQYDLPANTYRFTAAQSFRLRDRLSARLGGGVGLLSERGALRFVEGTNRAESRLRGTKAMGEAFGGLEFMAGRHCDVTLDAGYRRAKASGLTVEGDEIITPGGPGPTVDYSGFVGRAAVRIVLVR